MVIIPGKTQKVQATASIDKLADYFRSELMFKQHSRTITQTLTNEGSGSPDTPIIYKE